MSGLTHLDEAGRARMVDVSGKDASLRVAEAEGSVRMERATLAAILAADTAKGDVRQIAELAGIMAAKRTGELIPLCHPLMLDGIEVSIVPASELPGLEVRAMVRTTGRTGVEMEAMTAVAVACLTIYDMAKAIDREMVIGPISLVAKSGGRSGRWRRADDRPR